MTPLRRELPGAVHVGRQPVFDRDLVVTGYLLSFRDALGGVAGTAPVDADQMTSMVIVRTFADFGLEAICGPVQAWVTLTRGFLTQELPLPFGTERTVLVVPDGIEVDEQVVAGLEELAAEGYEIAVGSVAARADSRLLRLARTVTVDVGGPDAERLPAVAAWCQAHGVRVLADRVTDAAQLAAATRAGVDAMSGPVLSQPQTVSGRALPPNRLTCLELLATISRPDAETDDIERVLKVDAALTFRVLRAANSAASGLPRRVESLRQAMVMLGRRTLRAWVMVIALADASDGGSEQLAGALTRARLCERLAQAAPSADPDAAFTVGLLSSLDLLMGVPLIEVIAQMPLDDTLVGALLRHEGPLGDVLRWARAYEEGRSFADAPSWALHTDVGLLYLDSVGWSLATCRGVLAAA